MKGVSFTKGIGKHVNGSWYMRCRINGHEIIKAFPTRLDAENALKALKTQKKAADLGLTTIEPGETLDSLTDRYIMDGEARGLSSNTLRDYRDIRKTLIDHFGKRHHPRFNQREIMEYVRHRRTIAGGVRISKELKVLQTMLRHTVGQAYLTWEVPRMIDPNEAAPKAILSDQEIAQRYKVAQGRHDIERFFLCCILTGARPGDVSRLHSDDIEDGILHIQMGKRRGEPISIPIVDTLRTATEGVEGRLTCTISAAKMYLQRQKAGFHGMGFLRPTVGTWASLAGYDDRDVGILLGHAQWSVTKKHYIRARLADPFVELRREMLEAVEKRFLAAIQDE